MFADRPDRTLQKIFFNPNSHSFAGAEFLTTYVTSLLSATLGLAKCLKYGVARPIAPGGPLDGLLTGKFLVALVASAAVLLPKTCIISFTAVSPHYSQEIFLIKTNLNIRYPNITTIPLLYPSPSSYYFFRHSFSPSSPQSTSLINPL